ncbi:MAG TPA: hypothetical protein VGD88_02660 [Opitutaceae bacterium]
MSPLKTSLITALLAGFATIGGLVYLQRGRAEEARRLEAQNGRMRREAYQRDQTRNSAAAEFALAGGSVLTGGAPPPAARAPESYYRNEGNATPLASLQTFAWAGDRGDAGLVGRLLHLDPAARSKAEAYRAALPEKVRAQWETVDAMAASFLTLEMMARPFPSADVLATASAEPVDTDRVRLRMPSVPRDGSEFVQTTEGWKFVLTEAMVDNYIRQSQSQAPVAR